MREEHLRRQNGDISIYGDSRLLKTQNVNDKDLRMPIVYESDRLPMPVTVFNLTDAAPTKSLMVKFNISYAINTPHGGGVPNWGNGNQIWLNNYQSIYDKRLAR